MSTSIYDEKNPFLPAAPADGQHVFSRGPTDLGGNLRCTLCGAYRGSVESERPCRGEFWESGKMRGWAHERWIAQRLLDGKAARQIIRLERFQQGAVTRSKGFVSFGGAETFSVLLACGCTRPIEFLEWEAIHNGHITQAGCMGECAEAHAEANDKLNNRPRSESEFAAFLGGFEAVCDEWMTAGPEEIARVRKSYEEWVNR